MSQPPCELDVKRVIMTEEILVSQSVFDTVRSKMIDGFSPSNHRKALNEGTNQVSPIYKMYRHIDQSNKIQCSTSKILDKYVDRDIDKILNE